MTRQTKRPNRTEQLENRMDRVERMLEQLAERQIHADNRMDRLEQAIADTGKQIAQVSNDVRFLVTAIQGHISQPSPPAHGG